MIKIEVTGASIPEVADKLMAIGRSLYNTAVNDADNSIRVAMQAQRDAAKPEVAEAAPSPEPVSITPTKIEEVMPETPALALNFDTDVAPVVLRAVATKGKPFVEAAMAEFGVERASQLDAARWAELIDRLDSPF